MRNIKVSQKGHELWRQTILALTPPLSLTSCDLNQRTNLSKIQLPHLSNKNYNDYIVELMWKLKMLCKPEIRLVHNRHSETH